MFRGGIGKSFSGAGFDDQRRGLLGAVNADLAQAVAVGAAPGSRGAAAGPGPSPPVKQAGNLNGRPFRGKRGRPVRRGKR
jgi:hypothetical protein